MAILNVKAGDPSGRVALFERDPAHPGGEVFVAGDRVIAAADTPAVRERLQRGILVLVPVEAPEAPPAIEAPPAAKAAMPLADDLVELLAAAGFPDAAAVRAASDDDLLAVKGIGRARLRQIREALE